MPVVVFVLAAAVFAQGTSEFMLSGLLPRIAGDCHVSLATAGTLTSLFAIGMVLGAPTMAMVAGVVPRRGALLGFLGLFTAGHVVGALTTNLTVLLVTRMVTAVANAGFLAVALTALPTLVGAAAVGRASSVILSGVTFACVVGVPAGTVLGQKWGWHATFWAVAVSTALASVALAACSRGMPGPKTGPVLREWRVLGDRGLLGVLGLGILVNAGTFAGFTYLGTVVGDVAGTGSGWVPVALALFGVGSFVGVTLGDRLPLVPTALALAAVWALTAVCAHVLGLLLAGVVLAGVGAFGVGSALIATIVRLASPTAPRIAGALATTAFNVGAVAGPAVAGLAVTDAAHAGAAFWAGAACTAVAAVSRGCAAARRIRARA